MRLRTFLSFLMVIGPILQMPRSVFAQQPAARSVRCESSTGSDAWACSPTPSVSAYSALTPSSGPRVSIQFKPTAVSNTGAATLAISGGSALPIVKYVGGAAQPLVDNDIRQNGEYTLLYDSSGPQFVLVSPTGNSSSGGATTMTWVHNFPISGSTGSSTTNYPLWNLPTTTAAAPSFSRLGTSPDQMITMVFDEADGFNTATQVLMFHPGYASGGTIRIMWSSAAVNTNTVRWIARQACAAPGSARPDMTTWNTATTVDVAQSGTANQLQATDLTMNMTNCAAGGMSVFQIQRDSTTDPSTTDIPVYAVSYRYTINL